MIKISCCLPGGSFMPQGEKEIPLSPMERLTKGCSVVASCGYDCAEATVGMITSLSEEDYGALLAEYKAGRFRLDACNSFIPPTYPIVTDDAGTAALYAYAEGAIRRMAALGVKYVVFGSGAARRIPEDGDTAAAVAQVEAFVKKCDKWCGTYGMTLVIEPLNAKETNWINTVADGAALVRRLGSEHVKLLADAYHMSQANEPMSVLAENKDILVHCHVASSCRHIPGTTTYEGDFIDTLKEIGYDGIVTVECSFSDFASEAKTAADYLRARLA